MTPAMSLITRCINSRCLIVTLLKFQLSTSNMTVFLVSQHIHHRDMYPNKPGHKLLQNVCPEKSFLL